MLERRVRRAAAARVLNEAVNWSFISEKEAASVGGGDWTLANPISEELKVMRPSLLPGLLSATQRNADRGASATRLFEVGRRYFSDGERSEEHTSELQSLMRISYAVFCLKKKTQKQTTHYGTPPKTNTNNNHTTNDTHESIH